MTLNEYVRDLSDDEVIFIGSAMSFIFCGTAGEFKEDVDMLNNHWVNTLAHRVHKAEADYLLALRKQEELAKDAPELIRNAANFGVLSFRKALENCRYRQEHFTDFMGREVTGTYRKIYEEGTAIIIEGLEPGPFWTLSEYEKWRSKYKNLRRVTA